MRPQVFIALTALLFGCSSLPDTRDARTSGSSSVESRSSEVQTPPVSGVKSPDSHSRDRLTFVSSSAQPRNSDCLSSGSGRAEPISLNSKTKLECGFALPTPSIQLGFSYNEKGWNPGNATSGTQAITYVNEQHNLTRTFGAVDLYDKLLTADFEFQHSRYSHLAGRQDPLTGLAARVGLKGTLSEMTYWSEYSFKSLDFTDTLGSTSNDNALAKIGAEWTFDLFKPTLEFSRFRDNLSGDRDTSQTVSSKGMFSVTVEKPQWPGLSLSYARELKETLVNPEGPVSAHTRLESLTGKLSNSGSAWDAHATSSLSLTKDRLNEDSDSTVYDYVLGGSYQPITGLTFTPKSQLTQTFSEASQNRRDTVSASLGMKYSYAPWALDMALNGSFTTDQASDGTEDSQTTTISLSFEKDFTEDFNLSYGEQKLILRLNHSQSEDFISPDSSTTESSVFLLLKIAP